MYPTAYRDHARTETPYDFLKSYRSLSVKLADGQTVGGLDVHEYRNAADYWNKAANTLDADFDVDDGMNNGWYRLWPKLNQKKFQKGVVQRVVTAPRPAPAAASEHGLFGRVAATALAGEPWVEVVDDWHRIMDVFQGKGTPEHIEQALRLCHLFGLVGGTRAALQRFCDAKVGLDCNGFVGAYLQSQGSTYYPSASVPEYAPAGKRRSRLADVAARDVLVWTNFSHVAIIDKLETVTKDDKGDVTELRAWVCESGARTVHGDAHSDGLNYTQYAFSAPDRNRVFRVVRADGWEKSAFWSKHRGNAGAGAVYVTKLL